MRLLQDLRYAVRGFVKNPGFATAAILSLGIGIGANTAIFSVVNALLLHPLPYADSDRLVILWNRSPGLNIAEDWFSTAQYFDIKNGHQGFEQVAIAIGANMNLIGDGEPERVGVLRVSSNLLPMLGTRPALGRLFLPEEDSGTRATTAVLSHGLWTRRFGADPNAVGRSLTLNATSYEIIGVLPLGFALPREVLPTLGVAEDGEIVLALPLTVASVTDRDHEDYNVVGKLKRGVSEQQAQAEIDTITARLRRDHPDVYPPNGGLTFSIVPLLDQVVGNVRRTLLVLAGSVGFVLLIACANVANLLLARALAREKEIAVRVALGGTRRQILRQLLTESVLLAVLGGGLGVIGSLAAIRGIQLLEPKDLPRLGAIAVDAPVLAFTLLLSSCAGVLFGLAPAAGLRRLDVFGALGAAARGTSSAGAVWGRGNGLRRALVVAELALSVVLLVGAGLLIRSFARLQQVPPGFESLARPRFAMLLFSLFAALALALATIGIYGVMAYLVGQTTREIGIRMALGASDRAVLGLVLRQGLNAALTGAALGLLGAFALNRLMTSLLFGVSGADPLTFVSVALALIATSLVASYFPARRAARISPIVSLRTE